MNIISINYRNLAKFSILVFLFFTTISPISAQVSRSVSYQWPVVADNGSQFQKLPISGLISEYRTKSSDRNNGNAHLHSAVDIAKSHPTNVQAPVTGTVYANCKRGDHTNVAVNIENLRMWHVNIPSQLCSGAERDAGDLIGEVSGELTAEHVHLEEATHNFSDNGPHFEYARRDPLRGLRGEEGGLERTEDISDNHNPDIVDKGLINNAEDISQDTIPFPRLNKNFPERVADNIPEPGDDTWVVWNTVEAWGNLHDHLNRNEASTLGIYNTESNFSIDQNGPDSAYKKFSTSFDTVPPEKDLTRNEIARNTFMQGSTIKENTTFNYLLHNNPFGDQSLSNDPSYSSRGVNKSLNTDTPLRNDFPERNCDLCTDIAPYWANRRFVDGAYKWNLQVMDVANQTVSETTPVVVDNFMPQPIEFSFGIRTGLFLRPNRTNTGLEIYPPSKDQRRFKFSGTTGPYKLLIGPDQILLEFSLTFTEPVELKVKYGDEAIVENNEFVTQRDGGISGPYANFYNFENSFYRDYPQVDYRFGTSVYFYSKNTPSPLEGKRLKITAQDKANNPLDGSFTNASERQNDGSFSNPPKKNSYTINVQRASASSPNCNNCKIDDNYNVTVTTGDTGNEKFWGDTQPGTIVGVWLNSMGDTSMTSKYFSYSTDYNKKSTVSLRYSDFFDPTHFLLLEMDGAHLVNAELSRIKAKNSEIILEEVPLLDRKKIKLGDKRRLEKKGTIRGNYAQKQNTPRKKLEYTFGSSNNKISISTLVKNRKLIPTLKKTP